MLFRPSRSTIGLFLSTSVFSYSMVGLDSASAASAQIDMMEKQIKLMQGQLQQMKAHQMQRDQEITKLKKLSAEHMHRVGQKAMDGSVRFGEGEELSKRPFLTVGPSDAKNAPTTYAKLTGIPVPMSLDAPSRGFRKGQFNVGRISITLGGFVEMAGMFRSRNETADISSNFGAIPWGNSPNAHINEFHQSERQSRFAALVGADITSNLSVSGYTELDFQGAGSSSNSRQSNSYVLRSRLMYGELEDHAHDFYVMGGQAWSMATMFKKGMSMRSEDIPLVIDAQYVPGFTWTRNTGVRFVKGFHNHEYHIGLSIENPQSIWGGNFYTANGEKLTYNNSGGQVENSTTTYSTDVAPDIILKGTADPSFGHFEAYGLMRFMHDRLSYNGGGKSHTAVAGGGGGGMIIPIVKKKFDFEASGMMGYGIGRYGTSNLPDTTTNRNGSPAPLPEAQTLVGLIWHPSKVIDIYAYGGMEEILKRSSYSVGGTPYGYGNSQYNVAGCNIEYSSLGCNANIKRVAQGTIGMWWRYSQGDYGTLALGAQFSHTDVIGFSGVGGPKPHTDDNMAFISIRYMPFQ